jgi:PKD repeat protein
VTPDSGEVAFRVYGPDRTQLASDGFVDQGGNSRLTISAPETGTYYVEVSGVDRQTTTEYRLQSNRTESAPDTGPDPVVGSDPPTDQRNPGDGLYEDVNGDGTFDIFDVAAFLGVYDSPAVQSQSSYFDFDGSGSVDIFDVAALLAQA